MIIKILSIIFFSMFFYYLPKGIHKIAGNFKYSPGELQEHMRPRTQNFILEKFENMDLSRLVDIHVHVVGLGAGDTGIWVNEEMREGFNFYKRLQYVVYLNASGIQDESFADSEYIERLIALQDGMDKRIKSFILAFDKHYKKNGEVDLAASSFFVPNQYIFDLAKKYPKYFIPVISIHPYRKDALERLHYWGERGVKVLKWLPNAMGIDPKDPFIRSFYLIMKSYNMILLTHTGFEKAVEGEAHQKLGNPLRLRFPLSLGVKVVMAHMASLGECVDDEVENKKIDCFDLAIRMLDDERYEGLLFGEISALTLYTRVPFLGKILRRQDLHSRLIFGSDYPLPAINFLYRTGALVNLGYLDGDEKEMIDEIYSFNPLLFDYILKRTVVDPLTKKKFLEETFYIPKEMEYILLFK